MIRASAAISLILLALAAAACSHSSSPTYISAPSPTSPAASEAALAVADLTNVERSRAGLTALSVNARLNTAAQLQAEQLAALQVLEHEVPNGQYPTPLDRLGAAGYQWQAYGENLASGYPSASGAMAGWMNSPGHRAHILNATFSDLGTASVVDAAGRPYYVQVFGSPR